MEKGLPQLPNGIENSPDSLLESKTPYRVHWWNKDSPSSLMGLTTLQIHCWNQRLPIGFTGGLRTPPALWWDWQLPGFRGGVDDSSDSLVGLITRQVHWWEWRLPQIHWRNLKLQGSLAGSTTLFGWLRPFFWTFTRYAMTPQRVSKCQWFMSNYI